MAQAGNKVFSYSQPSLTKHRYKEPHLTTTTPQPNKCIHVTTRALSHAPQKKKCKQTHAQNVVHNLLTLNPLKLKTLYSVQFILVWRNKNLSALWKTYYYQGTCRSFLVLFCTHQKLYYFYPSIVKNCCRVLHICPLLPLCWIQRE